MKTRTFRLEKLVRDEIVASTEKEGGVVEFEAVAGERKMELLLAKLREESEEFAENRDPEELAQLLGILVQIGIETGVSLDELLKIESEKQSTLGGYKRGIYIRTVTLPEDNFWARYYGSQPDKYPEI